MTTTYDETVRFWAKVDGRSADECWPFLRHRNRDGYGRTPFNGANRLAHRIAYEIKYGPIPAGMCVCHRCDNAACCNPGHLFLGTRGDNNADAIRKGRASLTVYCDNRGERHGMARLTADDVIAIRAAAGTQREVAARFNVSPSNVGLIRNRIRWSHI